MSNIYTPGQILYIKPEYGEAYISVLHSADKRTYAAYELNSYELHTCCDLAIHEYDGNMYPAGVTFARGNGTWLGTDTSYEEIRQAEDFEKKMLFDALVRGFKDHDLGWENHFTDSTYFDILDWLEWEFDFETSTDGMSQPDPVENVMYEIQNYIWDELCKETGNYQACTDYVEPEMVNKQEFIAKVKRWLELETDWNMEYDEEGRNPDYGKIDELVKYLEE